MIAATRKQATPVGARIIAAIDVPAAATRTIPTMSNRAPVSAVEIHSLPVFLLAFSWLMVGARFSPELLFGIVFRILEVLLKFDMPESYHTGVVNG